MPLPSYDETHAPLLTDAQKRLAERIGDLLRTHKRGEDNAAKSAAIEKAYNLGGSTVRAMIHYLRTECRLPICSSGRGYFWAATQEELDRCKAHLRARRNSIDRTLHEMDGISLELL